MKVLVCTDGQSHSIGGIQRAITYGLSSTAAITGLYVVDPWLKKFHNELYSQGRKQFLEYVDECLRAEAVAAQTQLIDMCRAAGVSAKFRIRDGEPLAEILAEVEQVSPDVLITGRKRLNRWAKFKSRNIPGQLERQLRGDAKLVSIAQAA